MKFEEAKKVFFELYEGWVLYDVENNPNMVVQYENRYYWEKVLYPVLVKLDGTIKQVYEDYSSLKNAFQDMIQQFKEDVEKNDSNLFITTRERHKKNTELYNNVTYDLGNKLYELNQKQDIFLGKVAAVLDAFSKVLKENGVIEEKIKRLTKVPLSENTSWGLTGILYDIDCIYKPLDTPYSERDSKFYKRWILKEQAPDYSIPWFWEAFFNDWTKSENLPKENGARVIYERLKHQYNYDEKKVIEHIAKAFEEFWEEYELTEIQKRKDLSLLEELKQTDSAAEKKSIFKKWFGGKENGY